MFERVSSSASPSGTIGLRRTACTSRAPRNGGCCEVWMGPVPATGWLYGALEDKGTDPHSTSTIKVQAAAGPYAARKTRVASAAMRVRSPCSGMAASPSIIAAFMGIAITSQLNDCAATSGSGASSTPR